MTHCTRYRQLGIISSVALLLLTASCNGIYDGLYDEPDGSAALGYGFRTPGSDGIGEIQIDARDYTHWCLIDLHRQTVDTLSVYATSCPDTWDLAIHRYDVKTHGGAATTIDGDLLSVDSDADRSWTLQPDTDGTVVVDMSTMMEGYVTRIPATINRVLSGWISVDTTIMPPIYSLSGKVYLVRLADSSLAALQFTSYMDDRAVRGIVTIRYRYPL